MADDDEDEGFGDFKFVAYSASSNQISTNKTDNNDDDDWGDSVDNFSSPKQDLNRQTHPIQNFDFFGGLSDQKPIQTQPISKPNLERKNSVSNSPVWEKPKGALPLSLFGDDEEEEEQEEEEVQQFDQRKGFSSSFGDFSRNTQSPVKIEPNSGSRFAIKDIIVNLYTQSDQIKTEENLKEDQIGNQNGSLEDDDYDDEDGWEFKDASVDNRPEVSSPELKAEVKSSENANGVNGGADWFVVSNELKPTEMENGLVYELGGGATAERSFAFDPLSQSKNIGVENGNPNLVEDEDFADFQDSFFPTGAANYSTRQQEELKMGDHSRVQGRELMFADAFHVNGYESWDNQKAVPASHFSNGKLDSETSLFGEDLFSNEHSTSVGNQGALPTSNFSNGKLDSETSLFGEDLSSNKPLTSIDNHGALPASSFSNGKLDSQASLFGDDLSSNKPLTSIYNQGALPALNFSNGKLGSPASLFGEEDLFADKPSTSRTSQGASPVSNFSNTKLDSAGSLSGDDLFSYKPSNSPSNGLHNKVGNSNFVFNDLISNLYSQTEHAPAVQEATKNRYESSQANLSTDLGNDEDDFDENAWEFRAAPPKSFVHEATENGFDSFQTNLSPDLANGDHFDENAWEFRAAPPKSFVHEATESGFDSFQTNLSPNLANGEDDFDEDAWEFRAAPSHSLVDTHSADELQKNPTQEATENGYKFVQIAKNSNFVNGSDYFDGNSWDFEGSLSEVKVESCPGDPLQKISTASKPPVLSSQGATQNGFDLVDMFATADEANGNNDFAENSWDKGALSEGNSKTDSGDTLRKFPTESKLNTYIDFYCRLTEESYYLALHHLDALKKAKTAAALSSDDTKAEEIRHEIQEAYKILHLEGLNSETVNMDGRQPTKGYTKELLVLMKEPVIQMLDSEFNMSSRMSLAEKNLNSAIGIFEHSILMSKILTLGSMEDQFTCITKWSQILSACSQELKHGAFIWKQSLEKKVNQQILSKSKGQQYILSLGEIYRVVEVLRISTKLYWPWIVSTLANPAEIIALLEECSAAWLDSKLEDALLSFSNEVDVGYAAKILVESLKSVHNLDVSALQKQVLQEPICSISLVSLKAVSGMKEVVWNGEHFFLPLANLWANLISSYPPKLPHIYAIS